MLECASLAWQCGFEALLPPSRGGAPDFDLMQSTFELWRRIAKAAKARATLHSGGQLGEDGRPATDACICAAMARMASIRLLQVQAVASRACGVQGWLEACATCFRQAQQATCWAGQATALRPRDGFAMVVLADCSKTLLRLRLELQRHKEVAESGSVEMQQALRAARGTEGFPALGSLDICWMYSRAALAAEPPPQSRLLREPSKALAKALTDMVAAHRWQLEPEQAKWAKASRQYRIERLRAERQRRAKVGQPFGALATQGGGAAAHAEAEAGRPRDVPTATCRKASDAFAARLLHCAWEAMTGEADAARAHGVGKMSGRSLRCLARGGQADCTELLKPCVVLMAAAKGGQSAAGASGASEASHAAGAVGAVSAAASTAAATAAAASGPGAVAQSPVIVLLHICAAAAEEVASVLAGLRERLLLHGELSSRALGAAWAAAGQELYAPPQSGGVPVVVRARQRALSAAVGAVNRWREALSSQTSSPTIALRSPPVAAAGVFGPTAPLAPRSSKRLRLLPPVRSGHLSEAEAQVDSIMASTAQSPDRLQDASREGWSAAHGHEASARGAGSPSPPPPPSPGPASSGAGVRAAASDVVADGSWANSDDEDGDADIDESGGFDVPDVAGTLGAAAAGPWPSIPEDWRSEVDRWAGEASMTAVLGLGAGMPGSTVEACEIRAAREAAGEMLAMAAVLAQWAVACGHMAGPIAQPPSVRRSAKRDAHGEPIMACCTGADAGGDHSASAGDAAEGGESLDAQSPLEQARRAAVSSLVAAYNCAFPRHSPVFMDADERETSLIRHGPTMERVRSTASPAEAVAAVGLHAFPPQVHRRLLDASTFRGLRFSLLGSSACIDPADNGRLDAARAMRPRLGDLDSWGRSLAGLLCAIHSMSASAHPAVAFTETGVQVAWVPASGAPVLSPAGERAHVAVAEAAGSSALAASVARGSGAAAAAGQQLGPALPGRGDSASEHQQLFGNAATSAVAASPAGIRSPRAGPPWAAQPADIPHRAEDAGRWATFERTCDVDEAVMCTPSEVGGSSSSSQGGVPGDLAPALSIAMASEDEGGADHDDEEASSSGAECSRGILHAGASSGIPSPAPDLDSGGHFVGAVAPGATKSITMEARARWAGTPPQLFTQAMIARSHLENLDDEGALLVLSAARPDRDFAHPRDFLRRILQTFTEEELVAVFRWARQAVPERHWGAGLPGQP